MDGVDAYIALGSNLGDRRSLLTRAAAEIGDLPRTTLVALSSILETAPVGPPGQGDYLNAVAHVSTGLPPNNLLSALLGIEQRLGRVRREGERWGPRTIDLDLLLYDDRIIDEPGLRVPHPRLHERGFVLRPLAELAPTLRHPVLGVSVGELLARLPTDS